MKKYTVHLTREYSVEINAENEYAAKEFTELFVSGGKDDSGGNSKSKRKFEILKIKPLINEALVLDEI